MVKIQNPKKGQYKITIPLGIIKLKKWKKGTEIFPMITEKGEVILKEITP